MAIYQSTQICSGGCATSQTMAKALDQHPPSFHPEPFVCNNIYDPAPTLGGPIWVEIWIAALARQRNPNWIWVQTSDGGWFSPVIRARIASGACFYTLLNGINDRDLRRELPPIGKSFNLGGTFDPDRSGYGISVVVKRPSPSSRQFNSIVYGVETDQPVSQFVWNASTAHTLTWGRW